MTLNSQIPRTASADAKSRRHIVPLAFVTAIGLAAASYLYLRTPTDTPTADKVAFNAVPTIVAPQQATAMPEVKPVTETRPVANTTPSAPLPTPSAPKAVPVATPLATTPTRIAPPSAMTIGGALAMVAGDPVGARLALTQLVDGSALTGPDFATAIATLRELNARLVFSSTVAPGDPFMRVYKVESGDTLAKIAKAMSVQTDWRFIQRINGLKTERSLRVGQNLKVPVGAFHAEITKGSYLMRLYAGEGAGRVIVAAFPVGLGELDSTPTGAFMVRPKSKLVNPEWRNPRTGEHFQPDDPKNPIGERWIGLVGVEAQNQGFKGYGIHGTTEPDSVGKQASMGCVRMYDDDVAVAYELLTEPNSTVVIKP